MLHAGLGREAFLALLGEFLGSNRIVILDRRHCRTDSQARTASVQSRSELEEHSVGSWQCSHQESFLASKRAGKLFFKSNAF